MKRLLIFAAAALLSSCNPETQYCGTVVEKYRTDAGYKSSPQAHVVFYCDSTQRNIDVKVGFNTYANLEPGERVCFELNEHDLRR